MADEIKASIYVVSAIAGNFMWESSLNPNIWESNDPQTWDTVWHRNQDGNGVGGYGLGQWTNTNGDSHGRLWKMHVWLTANNYAMNDGTGQVKYILEEDYWINSNTGVDHGASSYTNSTSPKEFFESDSTDLDGLTYDWLECWEGVWDGTLFNRQENARIAFDYIREHKDDNPADYKWYNNETWIISHEHQMNNVMCLYFGLNGYDDGGKAKGKKMPLWMMLKPRH